MPASSSRLLVSALGFCLILSAQGAGVMRRERASPVQQSAFREALGKMLGGVPAQRLFDIETTVRPTYEAFPKNVAGSVPSQAIHSIVRGYFAQEHGWLIKGFEFSSTKTTELQESKLLREKAPAMAKALHQMRLSDEGLSLSDIVASVAVIEHMLLDESLELLGAAYSLNNRSSNEKVDKKALEDLLTSYLVLFRQGTDRNVTDFHRHDVYKAHAQKNEDDWQSLLSYEREAVDSHETREGYPYQDVAQIVHNMALQYGKWQNSECVEIKTKLLELEKAANMVDTGRVPFKEFSAEPVHAHYAFTETIDELQQIAALDQSDTNPHILVANYLAAPSNCIASSEFYSVCCLSECEGLMTALEAKVQASEVPLKSLLSAVSEISSSTMDAPRQLSPELVDKARVMANRHGGFVPLHSGDFKSWFHYAFPNECSFPTSLEVAAEDLEAKAVDQWLGRKRVPAWQVSAEGELIRV